MAKWLVVVGSVAAAVGFTLFGMATSYIQPDPNATRLWGILTIVGSVATVVGLLIKRSTDPADRSTY